jgi:hypothetical protein
MTTLNKIIRGLSCDSVFDPYRGTTFFLNKSTPDAFNEIFLLFVALMKKMLFLKKFLSGFECGFSDSLDPDSGKYPGPDSGKYPDPVSSKYPDPGSAKYSDPNTVN